MARNFERPQWAKKLAATGLVLSLVALCVLACLQFVGAFRSTVPVTLSAERAGLLTSTDAKVRVRGVVVGRVGSIETTDGGVSMTLNMDPRELEFVPSNADADIKANTVFGAKSINLSEPQAPSSNPMSGGDEISAEHVAVEVNTIFQRLVSVFAAAQPEKLGSTLGAVDTALNGRGDAIGQGLADLSTTVAAVDTVLDPLDRDIVAGADTVNVYADAAPDLLRLLEGATFTGNTLVAEADNLDLLLSNLTGLSATANGVLAPSKSQIISTLTNLTPTAELLGEQSPGLGCFIDAAATATDKAKPVFGGDSGLLTLNAGLLPGKEPYRYPEDLPKVNVDGPPTCQDGLSDPNSTAKTEFYVGDNADFPYQPRTTPKLDPTKLFQIMFGPAPRG